MLPRADLHATRPAAVEPATRVSSATDPRAELYRRISQLAIGRELQASVNAVLDDGTFLVGIDGAAARMALPTGTQVGDRLAMVFVAREPRPTFLLAQSGGSTPATLSPTARLIGHALQSAGPGADAVNGSMPLLASGQADAQHIAGALHEGLERSGLFYESHLQDWLNGSRSSDELAQEPQARFGEAQRNAQEDDSMRNVRLLATGSTPTDADVIVRADPSLPVLDAEAARMISLQLNTLEQQQLRWRGELWPGQELEWEVGKEQRDDSGADEQDGTWTSAVRFALPHLGNVEASIRLVGDRVHVQVGTGNEVTAATLRGHVELLADALAAAGTRLDSMLVRRDDKT